jgi:glutamate formiminotransferase
MEIVECVPNFSTSDSKTVESILAEIRKTKNAFLLDVTFDDYYNRLVVSFVGNKKSVLKAALNAAGKAVELIDMRKHKGQHPRIGAVDVVPFIPVRDVSMEECIELARRFGRTFTEKYRVPIYLYGEASPNPEHGDLDYIREGGYEKLAENIAKPQRKPDFGQARFNAKSGATIVGARRIMAGFNVNLGTADLKIAKKVARALHAQKGGFSDVKAMAAFIPERNVTQIGMSIGDFERTPLYRIFETLKIECARYNVPIVSSEFCGMAPLKALIDSVGYYLKVDNLTQNKILEVAIRDATEEGGKPE